MYPVEKCSLMLPMMGAHNGTDFPDFSPAPRTFTAHGGIKTVTDAASPYGSRALFESNGYLEAPHDAAWMFPAGTDFTIEAAVEFATIDSNQTIASRWNGLAINNWLFLYSAGFGGLKFDYRTTGNAYAGQGVAWTPALSTIYKVAIARQGTTYYFLIDGAVIGSVTNANEIKQSTNPLHVGAFLTTDWVYSAGMRMYDLRITTGQALYTEAYTPPARLMRGISGVVSDENGSPAQRTVLAITREPPHHMIGPVESDATTGAYELLTLSPGAEMTRIVLAQDAGTPGPSDPVLPDLVDRVIAE